LEVESEDWKRKPYVLLHNFTVVSVSVWVTKRKGLASPWYSLLVHISLFLERVWKRQEKNSPLRPPEESVALLTP